MDYETYGDNYDYCDYITYINYDITGTFMIGICQKETEVPRVFPGAERG